MNTVKVQISNERIAYVLCSAWEGGSTYWWGAEPEGAPYPANGPMRLMLDSPPVVTDEDGKQHTLDRAAIDRGLALLGDERYIRFLADIVREHDDASTADAFLQLCLFGKLVYG